MLSIYIYLRLFLAAANSVGDAFVILLLSSVDDDWDPWLESECRLGSGGIIAAGLIRWEMLLLLSDWGTGRNRDGRCWDIGNFTLKFENGGMEGGE